MFVLIVILIILFWLILAANILIAVRTKENRLKSDTGSVSAAQKWLIAGQSIIDAVVIGFILMICWAVGTQWYFNVCHTLLGILAEVLMILIMANRITGRRFLIWCCCAVLAAGGLWGGIRYEDARTKLARERMLAVVGITDQPDLEVSYYGSRTDRHKSADEYEIMEIYMPRGSDMSTYSLLPGSWTREDIGIEELAERLHITVDLDPVEEKSAGGFRCNAWFFEDHRYADIPLEDREFYLGYYDEIYNAIYIYHGHHLYKKE